MGSVIIEKIISGGKGLGHLENGMVVMVPGVLPGERAEIEVEKAHRGYAEAGLLGIQEPSAARTEPVCPLFGECGGCDLQHASYELQLEIKAGIMCEAIQRAGVGCDPAAMHPVLGTKATTGYRFRIRLQLSERGEVGFYRERSNEVVPVAHCLVVTQRINEALAGLAKHEAVLESIAQAGCREIELLHSPADNLVVALFHLPGGGSLDRTIFDPITTVPTIDSLLVQRRGPLISPSGAVKKPVLRQRVAGSGEVPGFRLSWGADCFSQVNPAQNEQLIRLVREFGAVKPGERVLDLYCGMGNFSVPLALQGASGIGIEQNRESVRWAARNMRDANCSGWEFRAEEAGRGLQQLLREKASFALAVCDPPRSGLGKSASLLAQLGPARIVYVSCDPATLARDLVRLEHGGYKVVSIQPVDMFPQTHHIESVSLLLKA